ncbi:MAG: hypothetical protein ATN36_06075 [Epulopiscium sp. Nele67-Bin005]|nr:MAG: hypothetical protein ATN36_06075 [Epulopiscium sp. Nele67-Bin005]
MFFRETKQIITKYEQPYKIAILDIETTGLIPTTSEMVAFGVAIIEQNKTTIFQAIVEDKDEEEQLLKQLLIILEPCQILFSYNGSRFDIPYLKGRLSYHKLEFNEKIKLIDIKNISFINFWIKNKFTRANIEDELNFSRELTITGKELAKIIKIYIQKNFSKEGVYFEVILGHNLEEVKSCIVMFEYLQMVQGLKWKNFLECKRSEQALVLKFKGQNSELKFERNGIKFIACGQTIEVIIPVEYLELKKFLEPHKDYFYIEEFNQIIHKSLANFIPSSQKKRVKKEACFITQTNFFIRVYCKEYLELWFNDAKEPFVIYDTEPQVVWNSIKVLL